MSAGIPKGSDQQLSNHRKKPSLLSQDETPKKTKQYQKQGQCIQTFIDIPPIFFFSEFQKNFKNVLSICKGSSILTE